MLPFQGREEGSKPFGSTKVLENKMGAQRVVYTNEMQNQIDMLIDMYDKNIEFYTEQLALFPNNAMVEKLLETSKSNKLKLTQFKTTDK